MKDVREEYKKIMEKSSKDTGNQRRQSGGDYNG
jgi:hypothetical protein